MEGDVVPEIAGAAIAGNAIASPATRSTLHVFEKMASRPIRLFELNKVLAQPDDGRASSWRFMRENP
jgi:hypothetical protein